jgi:hypothetical protein
MTEKTNAKTKAPADAATDACASFMQAFSNAPKFEIPETAREFVKRSALTAKERAADAHTGANRFAGMVEGAVINYVSGVAEINRKLLQAAYQDTEAALVAVEKLAGAKSLNEAIQLNVDYLRERGEVGMARAKDTAEYVTQTVSGGVKAVQDGIAKVAPFARAA